MAIQARWRSPPESVGGDRSAFDREDVRAVLEALGRNVYHVGEVDAGHTLKLMNNVMSMGNLLLAMETASFGAERGVDGEVMFDVLSNAGGASNQFRKRVPRALNRNFEPGFPVDLGRKDLGLAIETATRMELPMQAASVVHRLFVAASARGYGDEDAAAVVGDDGSSAPLTPVEGAPRSRFVPDRVPPASLAILILAANYLLTELFFSA